ncbi:RNA polymerase sigma factor [Phenylobacterium sp.]|jgi:RNA polymerase sigma-70 factor (ECF subfamily)|uniref:RNA polymerase sigma factor n=1 Tax=Phenylobacterium sp. TaxID=1871053 RepID=UPI002E369F4C|nr:RNA polymerase sigma factor [Phenylobacterium sp.]HEX3363905.1 RNA polymerase sigma factor [Phenylobacterium sp.]
MIDDATLRAWFFREVFPLEPALTRYIRRNWRNESEVADLRQEIYARIYSAARERLPLQTKPFLFTIARNHLINQAKRAHVVSIDHVAGLESSPVLVDAVTPDRHVTARDELRRVQAGLDRLPPRCREVVVLRKIEGLSTKAVAARLNIGVDAVEQQMVHGMRALVDFMAGGPGKIRRPSSRKPRASEAQP